MGVQAWVPSHTHPGTEMFSGRLHRHNTEYVKMNFFFLVLTKIKGISHFGGVMVGMKGF